MANYHLSIKVFSRGKGASAVGKAAYRAAELLKSEYDGREHDYTRKRGVIHKEIILPDHAPAEYADRAVLWNAVESAETPKSAQLAREIEVSLPVELTREQNIELVREYVNRTFVEQGMCADICVHYAKKDNPHAHIMLTMRLLEPDGTWGAKSRKEYILDRNGERIKLKSGEYKTRKICTTDWNEQSKADEWRAAWEEYQNAALEQYGHSQRVNHKSFARQGVEQVPTIHMGVAASRMEQRGIRTERGDINRAIAITNREFRQVRARITKLKNWLYAQPLADAPTFMEMMNGVMRGRNLKTQWQRIAHLKTAAKVLIFVQANKITTVEQLADKVEQLHERQYELANIIKADERRIATLNQHLANVETRKQHMAVYKKYTSLDPKKRKVYAEKHADEIKQYKSAMTYLKEHLNSYSKIPEKEWRTERDALITERYAHCDEYYSLKEDVRMVEVIRRGAEDMMRDIAPERTALRTQDLNL